MSNNYAIVSEAGEMLFSFSGDPKFFVNEIKDNIVVSLLAPMPYSNSHIYVYDFNFMRFDSIPKEVGHVYDYANKIWVDGRSLEEVRIAKWESIKALRDMLEFGGFSYAGNVYDSDQVSQARILVAAASGLPQSWTTTDNSVIELTTDEVQALANSMQAHISEAHELGRVAREAINAAQTIEEIEAVTL